MRLTALLFAPHWLAPYLLWADAARDRGYNGDLSELMQQDGKMVKEERNLMYGNAVGDTHHWNPTKLLKKPTSVRDAIWAWMNEKKAVLRIIGSILRKTKPRNLILLYLLFPSHSTMIYTSSISGNVPASLSLSL
jgi:hypothetical protein